LGRNPSAEGGTWCAILVTEDDQTMLVKAFGIVTPADVGMTLVENNLTELVAAVEALERLPDGWDGVLFSDSQNTIRRLTAKHPSFGGVPAELYARVTAQRKRFPKLKAVLLDGHPNAEHLIAGIGKRGYPVSRWNVAANDECDRLAGRPVRPPARPRKKKEAKA
jgi:ribonuclease HI